MQLVHDNIHLTSVLFGMTSSVLDFATAWREEGG